jgi:hypothetical protein
MELKGGMNSYLRQNVVAEPLINRWYATAYLISPMTAPLMVANGHLPTLRSFASASMVHQSWMYGPFAVRRISRQMDQSRKLCSSHFAKCAGMINSLRPQHIYIYSMGREPWLSYITLLDYSGNSKPILEAGRLVDDCRQQGLAVEDLFCKKEMHFEGIPQ